jgi:hypothetical protein
MSDRATSSLQARMGGNEGKQVTFLQLQFFYTKLFNFGNLQFIISIYDINNYDISIIF